MFVKSCLWGRRRDVHTVLGWFEPGLQAPLAKAFMGLSGLYATKLRYGGHESGFVAPGICKFATGRDRVHLVGAFSTRFWSFPSSFVTRTYPFLQNRVQPISMNMAGRPRSRLNFVSERAEVIGRFLQKGYERPTPLRAVPTRNGKPKERTYDATGLPTDPSSSPTRIAYVDDAVHRYRPPSGNQLARSQR